MYALVVEQALQQERLDAAVDAHQQDQQGKRQALNEDLLEKLEIDLEAKMVDMLEHQEQGQGDGAQVGQGLDLQEPDHVEMSQREPSRP